MEDSKSIPLVTVVIPMFNAFPFIGEMLECMEKQTYSNWELIIVDDGSTDESVSTVEKFAKSDSRIKLIKRPENRKKGGNTCRNIGLENAKGEYIIWFDADDLIATYCLEQRVKYMEQNSELDFAVTPAMGFQKRVGDLYRIVGTHPTNNDYKSFLRNLVPFQVVTNIYNKEKILTKGLKWDEDLLGRQDPDFNISALNIGLKYEYTRNRPDYFWRLNGNNTSVSTQLFSPQKIETNLYYFKKRCQCNNGEYDKALLFLAHFLFNFFIVTKDPRIIDEFLDNSLFDRHQFISWKYRNLAKIYSNNSIPIFFHKLARYIYFPYRSLSNLFRNKLRNLHTKLSAYKAIQDLNT